MPLRAQETVCASVKIEIKQELTLERQAFDAQMKINNTTDSSVIENVSVEIKVTDESGTPVTVTDNPNDLSAKFFVRLSNKENISAVDGTGTVNPKTTSVINWLLIPAPGSAGASAVGKKYLVGATLKYKFGGEETILNVSPDVITVKPLPLLTLDYFLTRNVQADDPLTTAVIEPVQPFTLGLRIKNNGQAAAKSLKIDSAQPKITENVQGLLINFTITGSYLNDAPVQNSLLIDFGDIAAGSSKMGRWVMETTLAGTFTEFSAKVSHSDELGGALTSILQAANTHHLIRDVRVDLPGRDAVRDFLAQDGDVIRVYESDGPDTLVTDRSTVSTLVAGAGSGSLASYRLTMPATAGFVYARLPDPFNGTKALGKVMRSDAKELAPENVWLSQTRNEQTKLWEHWVNVFDVNTTGIYDSEFNAPPAAAQPPVVQFVPDRTTKETQQVSFLVEASSPDGKPVLLSAAPLPAGATFTMQAPDPQAPGLARALFDWTPAKGAAGNYLIVYTAADGTLQASRSANIKVELDAPPPGPGTPTIVSPLPGTQVTSLKPTLSIQTSTQAQDPTTKVAFEVYADEAETQLVASAVIDKSAPLPGNGAGPVQGPTVWTLPQSLADNTRYWWRARASDGVLFSPWANGRFFVNTFNDPPDAFNLTNPVPDAEVDTLTPRLYWMNSLDKDGDAVTYSVIVYKDVALTEVAAQAADVAGDPNGSSAWTVSPPLVNHGKYYWRVTAKDALGAQTPSAVRAFVVNVGNVAPTPPVLVSPAIGGQSSTPTTQLVAQNSTDADNDLITYVFELDTVSTFDSGAKHSSGQLIQSGTGTTSWTVTQLVENKRYWWRVKAQDGRAESAWSVGDFLMNATNEAPPAPTVKNPGNGAWVATQQPSLEANVVVDPEGEVVRYQFEVYKDVGLTQKVAEGISSNAAWIVPSALSDKTTHWWRVRALDDHSAASAWSAVAVMYVSTGPYQDPTIAVTSPVQAVKPDNVTVGGVARRQATITWEGVDPNIEPTVALYYDTTGSGYAGTLIVDGIRHPAGAHTGSYTWDLTGLPPGAYRVYAVIYNPRGVGRAYAPGAVVVPNATQTGVIQTNTTGTLYTTESGGTDTLKVRLGQVPSANVLVPITTSNSKEGVPSPTLLTFTPANWSTYQTVTVTGVNDCAPDAGQNYVLGTGKAISNDPNYIGISGPSVNANNTGTDWWSTTNNSQIHICRLTIVSEQKVSTYNWVYVLKASVTNQGASARNITAVLSDTPSSVQVVQGSMSFGAVGQGDTSVSTDTVTVRSLYSISESTFQWGSGYKWTVTVTP